MSCTILNNVGNFVLCSNQNNKMSSFSFNRTFSAMYSSNSSYGVVDTPQSFLGLSKHFERSDFGGDD
jgi:hypothetical protein